MDLTQFLVWLTGGGSIVAVSWLFENWAWFQAQTAQLKQMLTFGASAVLSLGAWAVTTYVSASVLAQIAPVFMILSTLFASIFVGQLFHSFAKPKS